MSNRSTFEINHDYTHVIDDEEEAFAAALWNFLTHATERNAKKLERFGFTYRGTRHHSDPPDTEPKEKSDGDPGPGG